MNGTVHNATVERQGKPLISVVVPVYNEENSIGPFLERLCPVLEQIGPYEVLFCLDPSTDGTEAVIREAMAKSPSVGLLVFSRRFGQPAATIAGIQHCSGETCVVIDVDLQDPPELISKLYEKLQEGCEVVYAQRRTRAGETLVKRLVSYVGYAVIRRLADVDLPVNTGDFRILGPRAIAEVRRLTEKHGFLRGIVAFVGFKQGCVQYDRDPRHSGTGHYNRYLGSLRIGLNGIFGYSTYPLSFLLWMGLAIAGVAAAVSLFIVAAKLVFNVPYPMGIPTVTVLVLFLGGVQLAATGVIGEYIGRIYDEVRGRPRYIVDRWQNVRSLSQQMQAPRDPVASNAGGLEAVG